MNEMLGGGARRFGKSRRFPLTSRVTIRAAISIVSAVAGVAATVAPLAAAPGVAPVAPAAVEKLVPKVEPTLAVPVHTTPIPDKSIPLPRLEGLQQPKATPAESRVTVSEPRAETSRIVAGETLAPVAVEVKNEGGAAMPSAYRLGIYLREKGGHESTVTELPGPRLGAGKTHRHQDLRLRINAGQKPGLYALCARARWKSDRAESCRREPLLVMSEPDRPSAAVMNKPAVGLVPPLRAGVPPPTGSTDSPAGDAPSAILGNAPVIQPPRMRHPGGPANRPAVPAPVPTPPHGTAGSAVPIARTGGSLFGAKAAAFRNASESDDTPPEESMHSARLALVGTDILQINGSRGPEISLAEGAAVNASWPSSRSFVEGLGEQLKNHWLVVSDRLLTVDSCVVASDSELPNDRTIDGDGRYGAGTTMRVLSGLRPGTTYYVKLCLRTKRSGERPEEAWRHESNQITVHYAVPAMVEDEPPRRASMPELTARIHDAERSIAPVGGPRSEAGFHIALPPDLVVVPRGPLATPDEHTVHIPVYFQDASGGFAEWLDAYGDGRPPGDVYRFRYTASVNGEPLHTGSDVVTLDRSGRSNPIVLYWQPREGQDLPAWGPTSYTIEIVVNPDRSAPERNYDNNRFRFAVTVRRTLDISVGGDGGGTLERSGATLRSIDEER